LLQDGNTYTRMYAARSLGTLKVESALEPLKQATEDPAEKVRKEAAAALELLGSPDNQKPVTSESKADVPARKVVKSKKVTGKTASKPGKKKTAAKAKSTSKIVTKTKTRAPKKAAGKSTPTSGTKKTATRTKPSKKATAKTKPRSKKKKV
jgi:hypothetical protein